MNRIKTFFFAVAALLFVNVFAADNAITQTSTIDALLKGLYEGDRTLGEMKKYGDFGIGTVDFLDGELLLFEGTFYNVKSSGAVVTPPDEMKTPFCSVTNFSAEKTVKLPKGTDFKGFMELMDKELPSLNYFYAVKIKGSFRMMKARSVPRQSKPYLPLVEVVKKQPIFDFENIEGVLIGFRCPVFVKGINVPGYHLHFLSGDRTKGGHLFDFVVEDAELSYCRVNDFRLFLPVTADFANGDFSDNMAKALQKVEGSK